MIIKFQIYENDENFKKEDVVIRPNIGVVGYNELYLLLEDFHGQEWVFVFEIGNIIARDPMFCNTFEDHFYANFIFNRKECHPTKIKKNTFRKLSIFEKNLLNKAALSGKYDKYIELIKNKTGIDILKKEKKYYKYKEKLKTDHIETDPYSEEDWMEN